MKGKKKAQKEKIEIVKDCLANGLSYKETVKKYQVSYNNVYSWVQKYQKHGPDGLVDGRGRRKPNSVQTEKERTRAENAALRARNEYLEAEYQAIKKLKKKDTK
jgi:transposase